MRGVDIMILVSLAIGFGMFFYAFYITLREPKRKE